MGRRGILCLLAAALPFGYATRLQAHSFAAPFEDVDSAGNRCVDACRAPRARRRRGGSRPRAARLGDRKPHAW